MARTSEAKAKDAKTFRRVPNDIDHVAFVSKLVSGYVETNAPELSKSRDTRKELHTLMEWDDFWQDMLADLKDEVALDDDLGVRGHAYPVRSLDSAGRVPMSPPMAMQPKDEETQGQINKAAGGAPKPKKAPADETK